ncbi:MAG: T9SS type A sorting domain-containing protein [Flavobacteriales bacterium]|nr:T9SS type A sorting domain-containing protein [Flavobacteriales bacterium]
MSVSFPLINTWLGNCGTTLDGYDPSTVGINDVATDLELEVLPNPTTGVLSVMLPTTFRTGATLKVFDMVGKVVLTRIVTNNKERINLDLTDRNEGVYILQSRTERHVQLSGSY